MNESRPDAKAHCRPAGPGPAPRQCRDNAVGQKIIEADFQHGLGERRAQHIASMDLDFKGGGDFVVFQSIVQSVL